MSINPSRILPLALSTLFILGAACGRQAPTVPATEINLAKENTNLFANASSPVAETLAPAANPTSVVVKVDGFPITRGEVDQEVMAFLARAQGRVPPERLSQMRPQLEEQARENLVTRRLLEVAVGKAKTEVSPADLDAAIAEIRAGSPQGATLEDMLARNNMTMETFRERLTSDLRINKLMEQHTTNVAAATDEEVKKYYEGNAEQFKRPEGVKASHILITTAETDTPEQKQAKRAKLEKLRESIVAGEDFAKVASAESDCPSKAKGGDLGTFGRGQMVPAFETAAYSQKVGEVGPIVETQFGFHIIKVASHEDGGMVPMDEIKDRLSKYLTGQRKQEAAKAFVDSLRSTAKIELTP
jgi:peptidyl-prolyl cis-trans isomerase C